MAAQPIITEEKQAEVRASSREERGRLLFEESGSSIQHLEGHTWSVPGSNGTGYLVNLDERGERCECADFEHRGGSCKHIIAASIADAKSVTCSCCRERVLGRFVREVEDADGLLSWFVGDRICADCVRAGHWA